MPLAAPREAVEVYIEREREGETFPLVPLAASREAVEVERESVCERERERHSLWCPLPLPERQSR